MARQKTELDRDVGGATQSFAPHDQRDDRMRLLLETVPVALLNCDRDGLIEYFNSAAAVLWGRTPALHDPRDRYCGSLRIFRLTGEFVPLDESPMAQALRTGAAQLNGERMLERPDGSHVVVLVNVVPHKDDQGQVTGAVSCMLDITDRKRAEDALRRALAYLAEGQRLTQTGSWAWSTKTLENVFWSEEMYRIFCLEPGESNGGFLSRAPFSATLSRIHPDDRDVFEKPLYRAIREPKDFERDYRILLPDGTVKYIHSCGHPVLGVSGEVVELIGTIMDVTARKLSDALLAAEKHILEMIAGGAPLPAVLNDLCAAIDAQSPGLISTILLLDGDGQKLWPTAGPHSPPGWTQIITPLAIGPLVGSCGTAAFRRQRVVVSGIATDPRWVDYRETAAAHGLRACWSTPIFSITGQVLGTFAMYYGEPRSPQPRDLQLIDRATHMAQIAIERDRTQQSLREAQMNLARVSRITTVGELTAAIAHEVNQPLAAVEANASACVRWLLASPPNLDEARKAAGHIAQDVKRTGDIISRIRALLKKGEPARMPVDLNEIVQEIVMFTRPEATQQKVTVETELAAALPGVIADRVQLQQVILNLVMNAIESLSAVQDRPRLLHIRTDRPEPGEVRVAVRDTGVGLTPSQMNRLFEAFYTTKPNGLGMGLSISRSIVEEHGGRLWAAPNQGPGVTFQFTLPLESDDGP